MPNVLSSLSSTLVRARRACRLSQLELSMRLGVSQRHVSFVESGRSKPSRELLLVWMQALDLPLPQRNAALVEAGFAPIYSHHALQDPQLAQANAALRQLLDTHDPMPAMVIGEQWDILDMNRGAQWLASALMPSALEMFALGAPNMLDLLVNPAGFTQQLLNLHEAGPVFLAELRADALAHPELTPRLEMFEQLLIKRLGRKALTASGPSSGPPLLTLRFSTSFGELAFFRMFSTFGSPHDITLSSLKVEHMFAADTHTRAMLQALVKKDTQPLQA